MILDPARTVAELVLERPSRARVFEQLGLDYCCGGRRSLAEACARGGVETEAAVAALEAEAATAQPGAADWSLAPLDVLCDHIVEAHHDRLRAELPRLSQLLEKVERAHAAERPELAEVRRVFEAMRAELEEHTADEEKQLFPACRAGRALPAGLVDELEHEHEATGAALERLRDLTDGYRLDRALCNTHRATLDALRELELDLHEHVHEENNILFPRAAAAAR